MMQKVKLNFKNLGKGNKFVYYFVLSVLLVFGFFLVYKEAHQLPVNDFIAYWSSSRTLIEGGNPYSPTDLRETLEIRGLTYQPTHFVYNPPWVFPLIIIFGIFNRSNGQLFWLIVQIGIILYSTVKLWELNGGKKKCQWIGWGISFTFGPVVAAILLQGQITPFILLGLVGYLVFIDDPRKSWLAGAFAVLATIKPHVPYLFLLAFLLWSIYNKKWTSLLGFVGFFVLLNSLTFVINPDIFHQYILCVRSNSLLTWATPTIGIFIRLLFEGESSWISFIPALLGIMWLLYYWLKKKRTWNWKQQMPPVLFVSTLTSPYIWTYDMVILLIPVLLIFAALLNDHVSLTGATLIASFVAIDIFYIWLHFRASDLLFIWYAPVLLIWYLAGQWYLKGPAPVPAGENIS